MIIIDLMVKGRPVTVLPPVDVSHIPDAPGIYIIKGHEGQVLWVGGTHRLNQRVKQILRQKTWAQAGSVSRVEYVVTEKGEIAELQKQLYRRYHPFYQNPSIGPRLAGTVVTSHDSSSVSFYAQPNRQGIHVGRATLNQWFGRPAPEQLEVTLRVVRANKQV